MALDAGLRNILQSEQSGITLTIQLGHLLPILLKKRLVTEPEFQQLSSDKESDSEKNGKLIRIIVGKGEDAFDLFIEALQEEQEHLGHSSLARKLMDEKKRLKAQTKPEPLPRSKKPLDKPATSTSTAEPKSDNKPQQEDVNAVKYTLSVQGQNDLQISPFIMADDKMMRQFNSRLSSVENNVKILIVNSTSLEKKIEGAIENLENKLDELITFIKEPQYSTITETEVNSSTATSPQQDTDGKYIYITGNEYTEEQIYETVAESPVIMEYLEKEKLGDGKSGEFWLAVDKKRGSKMVIKKLFSKEIFMQEKNALAQVSHSNIIRLIDYSESESLALIFEYAENGNLLNCLKLSDSTFSISKLLEMSAGVACGMSELEKCSIIHCDILAKNILIDSHFVCKVASFSKAQCLKPGESSYTPPSNVSVMVPIKWAAPEILSKRKFSIKSDVWAFAVLLSEVFSQGNTPYPNMGNTEVKSAVQKGIKMAQPGGCPNKVYEVMKCCFEFDAKDRPSFAAIHEQLKTLLCKDPTNEASSSASECEDL